VTDGTEGAGFAGRPPGSRVLLGGRGRGPSIIAFRVVLLAASVVPAAGRGVEVEVRRAFLAWFRGELLLLRAFFGFSLLADSALFALIFSAICERWYPNCVVSW